MISSAVSVVEGYPGGGAVATAANKIANADSGAVTAAAQRLTKAAGDVNTNKTSVSDAVTKLDDAWQGASADEFVAYMSRFSSASTAAGESLTKAGTALGKVAAAIDDAQHFVNTRCEQVISDVKKYVKQYGDGVSEDESNKAIASFTSAAATDIENKLKETEDILKSAAADVQAAAQPSAKFTDIPDPGTQPYVPGPGNKVEWDPTPEKQQLQTAPQSAGDQGATSSGNTGGSGGGSSGGSGVGGGHHGSGGSGGGGGGGGGMGSSGGPPAGPVPGNVQDWIKQAQEILRANGINVPDSDVPKIWAIIQHESGGNPHAINNWDSNAAAGHPSKGLMQCIDPTFNSYKLPGHDDIWNPVDNICAGVHYAISRYGSLDNVPGIKSMAGGGAYRGY